MFRPDTDLYLLKCPLEMDNNNQLTFANATAQFNYFNSLPKIELEASTYQRKDSTVRYAGNIEDLYGFNYCMYRNHNYSEKWFYAYVTDLQWANEQTTIVSLKTDVYQTWQFELQFKRSFVEREHVNDDTIGLHTIPENLEYGEYICSGTDHDIIASVLNNDDAMIMIQVTTVTFDNHSYPTSDLNEFGGIPQGCYVIGVPLQTSELGKFMTIIGDYQSSGKGDAIVSISIVPKVCCEWTTKAGTGTLASEQYYVPIGDQGFNKISTKTITMNTSLNGYTPKNNKLYCYPYNYLYVSNNAGVDIDYHYENFDGNPSFDLWGVLEQGGSLFLEPNNSKKSQVDASGNAWSEGIPLAKLPNISWLNDYYLNWQAVNGANIKLQTLTAGLSWAGGAIGAMSGYGGDYTSSNLASDVANIMQKVKEARLTPPQAEGNVASGDIMFSTIGLRVTYRKMSIRAEYAKIIDDYFSAFGYRVNAFKTPNRTGRQNWNFVKTVGCNIEGNIPQGDMQEIKTIFNSGVTLWHNPATFLDYSQTNNIV